MLRSLVVLTFIGLVAGCPDTWIQIGDNCYKVSPERMNWYSAQEYCIGEGGFLIEINDEDEQASLFSFLTYSQFHWIGLSDAAQEGRYVWQHSFTETTYSNWRSGEPSNDGGNEDCIHLLEDFTWNDAICDEVHYSGEAFPDSDVHALCETPNV